LTSNNATVIYINLLPTIRVVYVQGSFVISRDAFNLVVKPIERMTTMIRKLAGTICILSSSGVPEETAEDIEDQEENETYLLEKTVEKLANIFDVRQDDKSSKGAKKSKAERMLTGSKTTRVLAHGSIYNISVIEKTPTSPVKGGEDPKKGFTSPTAMSATILALQQGMCKRE
jgi:hypothetical protein